MGSNDIVGQKGTLCFNTSVITVERSLKMRCKMTIKLYFQVDLIEELLIVLQ